MPKQDKVINTKPITKGQIRHIHIMLSRLQIDDDTYRAKLRLMFNVDSCKSLTSRQASTLIKSLSPAATSKPKPKRSAKQPTGRVEVSEGIERLASPAQHQLMHDLQAEVKWSRADGYSRWLKASFGLNRVASASQANNVIEGLKALKRKNSDRG